jgi:DNA topoisomerase-1
LSAGRVQSVAVRLIVEREEERAPFRTAVYWDLEAKLKGEGREFVATLARLNDQRIATGKDFDAKTGELKNAERASARRGGRRHARRGDSRRMFRGR